MIFIFIVTALTFALIMIFGYKAIGDFLVKGEQVEFYQFKTDLESSVKKIYTEADSVNEVDFRLPLKYEKICFVDLETNYPSDNSCTFDVYGCDVWQEAFNSGKKYEGADENVFLEPAGPVQIKVYKLIIDDNDRVEDGVLCVDIVKGKFKLRLEGKGDRTRISLPAS